LYLHRIHCASFIAGVVFCAVFVFECGVLFCVMCLICALHLILVLLPPGKTPFAVIIIIIIIKIIIIICAIDGESLN
jgi:hypothetical protein